MVIFGKVFAIVFILIVVFSFFGDYVWIPVLLIIIWFVIRFFADIFWWGKDKSKW